MMMQLIATLCALSGAPGALPASSAGTPHGGITIAGVHEHHGPVQLGIVEVTQLRGVLLQIVPQPGMNAPYLRSQLQLAVEHGRARGCVVKEASGGFFVRERGASFEIGFVSDDEAGARRLIQQAERLTRSR